MTFGRQRRRGGGCVDSLIAGCFLLHISLYTTRLLARYEKDDGGGSGRNEGTSSKLMFVRDGLFSHYRFSAIQGLSVVGQRVELGRLLLRHCCQKRKIPFDFCDYPIWGEGEWKDGFFFFFSCVPFVQRYTPFPGSVPLVPVGPAWPSFIPLFSPLSFYPPFSSLLSPFFLPLCSSSSIIFLSFQNAPVFTR